jgi:DNA-binding transcriptional LysR family regulator
MIDKLEYLLALAREKHFGRAALACGVTQPTLSSGIRQLEETLDVLLVVRGSRYHGLTTEGDRVLGWARRIVADARAMRAELGGAPAGLDGRLRLAVIPSALPDVARLTTPYRALHPAVTFSVLSRTSEEILELLDNLEIDAGLTYLDGHPLGRSRALPLYHERYCLAIAETEAAGLGATIGWVEVGQVPLCLLTPDMQNRRIIDARLQNAGGNARTTLESNSVIVLLTHVRTGLWASVLSEGMAASFGLPPGIRVIPIADRESGPSIGLVYGRRDPVTPLTAALLEVARSIVEVSPDMPGS